MINFHKGVAPLRTNLDTAILCHIYDIQWIKMSIYILIWLSTDVLTSTEFSPCSIIELDICDICNPPCYSSIKIFNMDGFVGRPHICHYFSTKIFHTQIFLHTNLEQKRHKFRYNSINCSKSLQKSEISPHDRFFSTNMICVK